MPTSRLLATALAAPLAMPCLAQSWVASPTIYDTCEAPSQNTFPFTGLFHYQQFHTDLVGTPRLITGIGWRRDGLAATTTYAARTQDIEITMGDATFATITSTFATNYAAPPTVVYTRKSTNVPDIGTRPDVLPSPWGVFALLVDTPYLYLGTRDLAYEVVIFTSTPTGTYFLDYVDTAGATSLLGGFSATGTGCTTSNGVMKVRATIQTVTASSQLSLAWTIEKGPASASSSVLVGFSDPGLQINLCNGELVHTDGTLVALPVTTSTVGAATTATITVPFQPVYTFLTPTAQAAALDASQPLGLAVSNGIKSVVPPIMPLIRIARIYGNGSPTVATGILSLTSGLVTRFRY